MPQQSVMKDLAFLRLGILVYLLAVFVPTTSLQILTRSSGRLRKEQADSIPMPKSSIADDYSDYPDVIVAMQKAGVSESDFSIVKEFVEKSAKSAKSIASTKDKTRFAVTAFSSLSQHMIAFEDCCQGGISQLQRMITNEMEILHEDTKRFYDKKNHSDLSPESVDVEYAVYSIRENQITDPLLSSYKPTILYLLLNFQTEEMSFNILNAAMPEVKILRNAGIHVVTVIVDPFANRQPHIDKDFALDKGQGAPSADNSLNSREQYEQYENKIKEIHEKPNDYNVHLEELIDKHKISNDPKYEGIAKFNDPRIDDKKLNKNLVLEYAREMSSIPEHGFKLDNYSQLLSNEVFSNLSEIISNPMSWFGEGQVETSCQKTRNLIHRLIWTPDYYTTEKYPNAKGCSWRISVPPGQFVSLKFETFKTESVFDRVTIYDGENKLQAPVLGVYSGDLTSGGKSITVNSTKENMMVTLETDGGNNDRGFLATWNPSTIYDQIEAAEVVFLLDVSGSILMDDISTWVYEISKFFLLSDHDTRQRTADEFSSMNRIGRIKSSQRNARESRYKGRSNNAKEQSESHIGLVSFAEDAQVIKSIETPSTADDLKEKAESLQKTKKPTFIGRALDFTRTKQFLRVIGESNDAFESSTGEESEFPKRAVFILSDWHSVDDPRPHTKLMCDWNIIPIFIGFGKVNLQVREDLVSTCGFAYQQHTPLTTVMDTLKEAWRPKLIAPTTSASASTTASTLPIKTSTIATTTNNLSPLTTTMKYPYTGTYPTLPPAATPYFRRPDEFNYLGVSILVVVIGVLETTGLIALVSYKSSIVAPLIQSLSTESMALDRKRREMIEFNKLPKPQRMRILKQANPIGDAREPIRRKTRYPHIVNSFFTGRAVLPKHFEVEQSDK